VGFAGFGPLNADVFVADADGSNPRPFLPHPAQDYNASYTADGRWIVFTSERAGSADIWRARANGTGLERLTDDTAFDDQAAASPDGRSIAFISSRGGKAGLWVIDTATRRVRQLAATRSGNFRPSWSPDGQWIAFSSDRDSSKSRRPGGFEFLQQTELYVVRVNGRSLKRVSTALGFAGSPVWSRDGRNLIYYGIAFDGLWTFITPRKEHGTSQIKSINVQTGQSTVLSAGNGEKWSPQVMNDDRIAYVAGGDAPGLEFTDGTKGMRGIFNSPHWSPDGHQMVFDRDTGGVWPPYQHWHSREDQFATVRVGVFPSWSADGKWLVSADGHGAVQGNSIAVMGANGANSRTLFSALPKSALAPAWSPDGKRIAFSLHGFAPRDTGGGSTADIALINADGSGLTILTPGDGNYGFPAWAPDGKRIVYRAAGARRGLLIMDLETRQSTPLTDNMHDNLPAWSPDGALIVFTSKRDGDYEIYTIRPDGSNLRRLTQSPGNDAHNAWSPDGKWLAFACSQGGYKDESALHLRNPQSYGEICVMRADGSDIRVLTDNQYEKGTPNWQPMPSPPK
jgi:TolB protein